MKLEEIIDQLNIYSPRYQQDWAVTELANLLSDPNKIVMPRGKDYWYNSARALKLMGRPRIDSAIPYLFLWLKDLSNPGSGIIFKLLKDSLPKTNLMQLIERNALLSIDENDNKWFGNLMLLAYEKGIEKEDFKNEKLKLELKRIENTEINAEK